MFVLSIGRPKRRVALVDAERSVVHYEGGDRTPHRSENPTSVRPNFPFMSIFFFSSTSGNIHITYVFTKVEMLNWITYAHSILSFGL
jgi:hypothetical protein